MWLVFHALVCWALATVRLPPVTQGGPPSLRRCLCSTPFPEKANGVGSRADVKTEAPPHLSLLRHQCVELHTVHVRRKLPFSKLLCHSKAWDWELCSNATLTNKINQGVVGARLGAPLADAIEDGLRRPTTGWGVDGHGGLVGSSCGGSSPAGLDVGIWIPRFARFVSSRAVYVFPRGNPYTPLCCGGVYGIPR